ncbi:MAG: zinc-ribbon domain-containing protein [Paracoccaceae bacterium]
MRLICPNCDAQYDVPDSVIPTEGRDVQCSSCSTTWFQNHPDHQPDESGTTSTEASPDKAPSKDDADVAAKPPAAKKRAKSKPKPKKKPVKKPTESSDPEDSSAEATKEDVAEDTEAGPQARKLDSSVEAILKAEADRETEAREQDSLETQPGSDVDDGLVEKAIKDLTSEPTAQTGDENVAAVAAGAAAIATTDAARRDLLPDIEEINSTLRSSNDRDDTPVLTTEDETDEPVVKKRSGGFRRGFVMVVALAAIAGLVYVYAPQIAQKFPQADATLNSYVAYVDSARVWLDSQLALLLTWLDKTAAAANQ